MNRFVRHENLPAYVAGIHKRFQDNVIDGARMIYAHKYQEIEQEKGCLYWAAAFNEAATARGLDAIIQVGSAQFQYRADTNGVGNTHFSYMFGKVEALARIAKGLPPELHAWNWLRESREVVDLTTGFQAAQARRLLGYEWEKEFALPEYFWGKPDGMRFVYYASAAATIYGLRMLGAKL